MWKTPIPWLAGVPLLAVGAMLLWNWGALNHPGMQLGRGVGLLLLVGCLLSLVLPVRLRWDWRSPLPWLALALGWQVLALAGWAVVREPGIVWVGERAVALLTAMGVAAWCRTGDLDRIALALAAAGAGCLALCAISPPGWSGTWPTGPDIPFGNANFVVGGSLPLLALALPSLRRAAGGAVLALGLAAAVVLGLGLLSGDAARAALLGLGAMVGTWCILRLPARSHGRIFGIGEVATILGLALLISGVLPVPGDAPSNAYRVHLWQAACQAIQQAPFIGSGPASGIVVLQDQAASPLAWLCVPSYAEHPHQEFLNALVEGGLVQAWLLLAGLLATLAPVWRRRSEPLCEALLIAWAGALTLMLVESHLGQPGPLLLLALLAGLTWACTQEEGPAGSPTTRFAIPLAVVLAGALQFALLAREFSDGGSPTMIEARALRAMEAEPARRGEIAAEVRRRIGDLDTWLTVEGVAEARARRFPQAEALAIEQLARLPVDDGALDLALRLRNRLRTLGQEHGHLDAALQAARIRGVALLGRIPVNDKNRARRERLAALYAGF